MFDSWPTSSAHSRDHSRIHQQSLDQLDPPRVPGASASSSTNATSSADTRGQCQHEQLAILKPMISQSSIPLGHQLRCLVFAKMQRCLLPLAMGCHPLGILGQPRGCRCRLSEPFIYLFLLLLSLTYIQFS